MVCWYSQSNFGHITTFVEGTKTSHVSRYVSHITVINEKCISCCFMASTVILTLYMKRVAQVKSDIHYDKTLTASVHGW